MIEPALIDRVLFRVPQIEAMLSDPATAADQNRFRKLLKEHSHLKHVAGKAQHYRSPRVMIPNWRNWRRRNWRRAKPPCPMPKRPCA
jgi:protein subunit release factor A